MSHLYYTMVLNLEKRMTVVGYMPQHGEGGNAGCLELEYLRYELRWAFYTIRLLISRVIRL